MHINDRANMSVFKGTEFEGLTYMQVRRKLTPEQLKKFNSLEKRIKKVAKSKADHKRLVSTYR